MKEKTGRANDSRRIWRLYHLLYPWTREARTGWSKCPTRGDIIDRLDKALEDVNQTDYPFCATAFNGTLIEEIIFSGESFQEEASQWARGQGWTEPS